MRAVQTIHEAPVLERREPAGLAADPLRYWYILAIAGAVAIAVGVIVLAKPDRSLKALAVITGIYLLGGAVLIIVRTFSDESRSPGGLFLGLLMLVAGLVVVRHPSQSVVVVSMALGIYFVVAGTLDLARAIVTPPRILFLLRGALLLAAGIAITSSPEISVKTLALLTGIGLCAQGAVEIVHSLLLRAEHRRLSAAERSPSAPA